MQYHGYTPAQRRFMRSTDASMRPIDRGARRGVRSPLILSEGLRPSDSPTRASRAAVPARSVRGSLARLARDAARGRAPRTPRHAPRAPLRRRAPARVARPRGSLATPLGPRLGLPRHALSRAAVPARPFAWLARAAARDAAAGCALGFPDTRFRAPLCRRARLVASLRGSPATPPAAPLGFPTRALARRCAGALRSRLRLRDFVRDAAGGCAARTPDTLLARRCAGAPVRVARSRGSPATPGCALGLPERAPSAWSARSRRSCAF